MNNKIEFIWKNGKVRRARELDAKATSKLMDAIVLCYPNNNRIATKLSKVLPETKKIIVNRHRAEENPEGAFIICELNNGKKETVSAPLKNRIMWNIFQEWGEGE